MNTPVPLRSFRLVCNPRRIPLVEALLRAQGFVFEEEPFYPLARRLRHEPIPLGSSIAAAFGYIYIQDRSSMLPPLALAPPEGGAVLDMCACPGSKTGLVGQLTGPNGFVLGNEPVKNRLLTLRRNLAALNLLHCATCSHPGERMPLSTVAAPAGGEPQPPAGAAGWPFILLDPPCSGWGTVEKHPKVLDLWQGDKIEPLINLQRRLLREAFRLLEPGGRCVYSTCTTNIAENEEQVRYACDELGFRFLPLSPIPGFSFAEAAFPQYAGALRVDTGPDGQGFFTALLEKPEGPAGTACPDEMIRSNEAPALGNALFTEAVETGDPALPFPGKGRRQSATGFSKQGKAHKKVPRTASSPEFIERTACAEEPWLDVLRLPPGELAVYNNTLHLLPAARRGVLPEDFAWKGFVLGRLAGGRIRIHPGLRALMPDREEAQRRNLYCIDVDAPAPILSLLAGQSLPVDPALAGGEDIGLYFQGLPLCRLVVKGRRAVLPAL